MPNAEGRARQLSWLYYNQGLEQAEARDLSGAADKLRQSLQLNKRNTQARNLLGLIYYETGEVIAALQEWLTSQSYQAKDNLAEEYITIVQMDQPRLRAMSEAIATYNKALQNCREGNEDIAAIQLRRIVSKNPNQIRAAQLLALIYIKEGKYGQARRILRKIAQIDRANPDTIRYLHEIEVQTKSVSRARREQEAEEEAEAGEAVPQHTTGKTRFQDTPMFSTLFNLVLGVMLGILAVGLLVVPAVRRNVVQDTNTRIVDYTTTLAEQKDRIRNLEKQIEESNAVVAQAKAQVESTQTEIDSYDSLIKAYHHLQAQEYMKAGDEITKIDKTKLSQTAIEIYNSIDEMIVESAYDEYANAGHEAHFEQRWEDAIKYYSRALEINAEDPDVWYFLGNSYNQSGQTQQAIETFQEIINRFPNTHRAESAEYEITVLGGTPQTGGGEEAASGDESGETGAEEGTEEGAEEGAVEETGEETYYEETATETEEAMTEEVPAEEGYEETTEGA